MQYVFLVLQHFQLSTKTDPILQLPLYMSTSQWRVVGLHSLHSKLLYLIDISSLPEYASEPYNTFLYCPWQVDYMWTEQTTVCLDLYLMRSHWTPTVSSPFKSPHSITELERTTHCPRGYQLAYNFDTTSKVCFLIRDQIHTSHWSHKVYSSYVASLRVQTASGPIELINVYNPRDNGPQVRTWNTIAQAIEATSGEIILLGVFNSHHPEWGGVHSAHAHAAHAAIWASPFRDAKTGPTSAQSKGSSHVETWQARKHHWSRICNRVAEELCNVLLP